MGIVVCTSCTLYVLCRPKCLLLLIERTSLRTSKKRTISVFQRTLRYFHLYYISKKGTLNHCEEKHTWDHAQMSKFKHLQLDLDFCLIRGGANAVKSHMQEHH